MLWYKIAKTIGRSVAECKNTISNSEYMGWSDYFDYEYEQYDKIEHYLAHILNAVTWHQRELPDCYFPPIEPTEDMESESILSPEDGEYVLAKLFG